MWKVSLLIGFVSIIPLIWFENYAFFILASAVSAGILVGIVIEVRKDFAHRKKAKHLATARADQLLRATANFAELPVIRDLNSSVSVSSTLQSSRERQSRESAGDYTLFAKRKSATAG